MITYIKNHKIKTIVTLVILGGVGFYWYGKTHTTAATVKYVTVQAQKATVISSVSGTGQVSEENKIDLSPKSAGTITSLNVKQGDKVKAGQIIAVIDESSNLISLKQAQASLASAQASYDKLVAGATSDTIALSNLSVTSAQQALDQAKQNYQAVSDQQALAVSKAWTAWLNDNLQAVANDSVSTVNVTVSGAYTGTIKGQYVITLYSTGTGLYYSVDGLNKTSGQFKTGVPLPIGQGLYVTFANTGSISQTTSWTINIPNDRSNNYLSMQTAYNSALQSQTQSLSQAQNSINTAENNLKQAQIQLSQTTAAPTSAEIASAEAQVLSAQAQVASAQKAYDDNILKSPWDGTVAALTYTRAGVQASAGTALATVITDKQVASISLNEVDVAKVKTGQKVTLTFDAISDLSMTGQVAQIDTIGTVSQGVVTYNVKISLDTQDERVKPGMSVSAAIISQVAADVLTVPNSAIKTGSSGSYVQVLNSNGQPENKTVTIGISDDTNTQILSGLSEGDAVVTQTISSAKTTTTSTQSSSSIRIPGLGGGR